jgi:hypothetical protein
MSQRTVKREKKAVRNTVKEIMGDEVPTATLAIINRYKQQAMIAWSCFCAMIAIVIMAIIWRG